MPTSEDQFGNVLSLRDSNFYFAWISFTNPLQPAAAGIAGDYNANGTVDAADYVLWRDNLNSTVMLPNDPTPGNVTPEDLRGVANQFRQIRRHRSWYCDCKHSGTGVAGAVRDYVPG